MTSRFVERKNGKIVGATSHPSDRFAEELDDQHPDYLEFLNPPESLADKAKREKREAVKAKPDNAPVTMKDLRDFGLVP